jgi:hypothetical protein
MLRMAGSQCRQGIPTKLSVAQFEQFVLPHLSTGRREPAPTLGCRRYSTTSFNCCTWAVSGRRCLSKRMTKFVLKSTTRAFIGRCGGGRQMAATAAIFAGSVRKLHQGGLPELTVIHGDGTTTAAKKGGDNLGYSGHKHLKGDKVVAFCDRRCNVSAIRFCPGQPQTASSTTLTDGLSSGLDESTRGCGSEIGVVRNGYARCGPSIPGCLSIGVSPVYVRDTHASYGSRYPACARVLAAPVRMQDQSQALADAAAAPWSMPT